MSDDADKVKLFPSLMEGPKAQHTQTELRTLAAWNDVRTRFTKIFEVDRGTALTDLQSLQVTNWDVDAYITQFNAKMALYPWSSGDQDALKDAFVRNLPYKTKEKMLVDRDYQSLVLTDLQNEAKRTHKALS